MPCSEDDDTQSYSSETPHGLSKAELRKPARHSKLEKADILELTVKHLQTLQRQQLAAAIAADPAVLHRFKSGFGDCAVEVRKYLSRLANVPTGLRYRLGNHLNTCISGIEHLHPSEYPPLVPDPLRLDDERPSAFHFVRSTRPNSPPLSPLSCDSACDSSTELETPPRPVQKYPFPTPPSNSASDLDTSPEQKPTVSSTTITPENLKTEPMKTKKLMEPLSIVIDVENYKIGIDASPKRAVDYSIRNKLKRHAETIVSTPKVIRLDAEKTVTIPERQLFVPERDSRSNEKLSAFRRIPERVHPEHKLSLPPSIPTPVEVPTVERVPRSVISHTAESLAQSSTATAKSEDKADARSKSPQQSTSSEMWRPW
ncbi:unnamed protein product [Leptidea sinapis]|uniref:Orange domain-containing protein n=1 Tax=Leptidea sinapis TaxID=189913 RepID=A0A5E4PZU6_9NEOP|nr:unnamed protein product [Leptidea sinapis]